jgi:hypothetical protein
MAAVREIEGLINERKIGDDVADDGVLEHRPVLPRGIMRVTTPDAPGGAGFERNPYRSPPALDEAYGYGAVSRYVYLSTMRSLRQCFENVLNQTTRFLQLIESNGNARGNVTVGTNNLFH